MKMIKSVSFLLLIFVLINNSYAQCDPNTVPHYNIGDFPFISSNNITVNLGGTNSGTLGPYGVYGCSNATLDANTIRLDPGDEVIFSFSESVTEVTLIIGVVNVFENGIVSTNNGVPTLSTSCPDLTIVGNSFESQTELVNSVVTIQIPAGATEISVSCSPVTSGAGNGVFTIDFLDCIVPGGQAPIPTLSQWGVITLSMIIMIFGVVAVRQRKLVIG